MMQTMFGAILGIAIGVVIMRAWYADRLSKISAKTDEIESLEDNRHEEAFVESFEMYKNSPINISRRLKGHVTDYKIEWLSISGRKYYGIKDLSDAEPLTTEEVEKLKHLEITLGDCRKKKAKAETRPYREFNTLFDGLIHVYNTGTVQLSSRVFVEIVKTQDGQFTLDRIYVSRQPLNKDSAHYTFHYKDKAELTMFSNLVLANEDFDFEKGRFMQLIERFDRYNKIRDRITIQRDGRLEIQPPMQTPAVAVYANEEVAASQDEADRFDPELVPHAI